MLACPRPANLARDKTKLAEEFQIGLMAWGRLPHEAKCVVMFDGGGADNNVAYRDIEQLSVAGVPLTVERGAMGGFQLLDGWRTQLTGLTLTEAQAISLGRTVGPRRRARPPRGQ